MEFKDYYKIMGVAHDATQDEIKRAYRQLARKFHPDVSKLADAETRFQDLGEANAVLKDVEKRAAYDQLARRWKAGENFEPPPDWNAGFEFSGAGRQDGNHADRGSFSDFFESIFGRGAGGESPHHTPFNAHGQDHHAKVLIDLEDTYSGASRTITLQTPELDAHGHVSMRAHMLNVTIPRGIRSGQNIRLTGQGTPGVGQGRPGDLYLEVGFNPHAYYRVDQRDVYLDLPVAPWEAVLGATVSAPTPDGPIELKIPPGSVPGSKLRLKGRGIPGTTPGNFYAVLHLTLPPADDEAATALYGAMAEQFKAFNPRAKLGI